MTQINKSLAKFILKVIDKLISHDQTGYLKGCYIGENIHTVHDIIIKLNLFARANFTRDDAVNWFWKGIWYSQMVFNR